MTLLSRRAAITAMCLAGLAMRFGRRPVVAQSGVDWLGGGIARDHSGAVVNVFGLEPTLAHDVLQPAPKDTPLPDGYAPTDLIDPGALGIRSAGAQLIRKLITRTPAR